MCAFAQIEGKAGRDVVNHLLGRDEVRLVARYFGMSESAVIERMLDGERELAALWRAYQGQSEQDPWEERNADPLGYYLRPDVQEAYIFTLVEYWLRPECLDRPEKYRRAVTEALLREPTLLDWGAGTGDLLLYLGRCMPWVRMVYADFPGPKREFAMWRAAEADLRVRFRDLRPLEPDERFGAVVCLSTLEHVPDLPATVTMLASHVTPGGVFVAGVDWVYNRNFPMHLPETAAYQDKFADLVSSLGFECREGAWHKIEQ